jgi:hypothetical protein
LATDVHEPNAEPIAFDFYPNPATEKITIAYQLQEKSVVRVGLYGADGRLVQLFLNQERSIGDYLETYALSQNIQAGMYWISVETEYGTMMKQIVVVK